MKEPKDDGPRTKNAEQRIRTPRAKQKAWRRCTLDPMTTVRAHEEDIVINGVELGLVRWTSIDCFHHHLSPT